MRDDRTVHAEQYFVLYCTVYSVQYRNEIFVVFAHAAAKIVGSAFQRYTINFDIS